MVREVERLKGQNFFQRIQCCIKMGSKIPLLRLKRLLDGFNKSKNVSNITQTKSRKLISFLRLNEQFLCREKNVSVVFHSIFLSKMLL